MSILADLSTPALRMLDPEDAHQLTLTALRLGLGPRRSRNADSSLAVTLAGLELPNPLGLAAGFDKDAQVPDAMLRAGLGFVECGTTTPLPQSGNPRPRIFRLSRDRAVINRLGFNNQGHEAFASALERRRRGGIVGANIGANKDSANRAADYVAGLRRLWRLADYFTLNVSSPNTPGLRDLQAKGALEDLLGAVAEARSALTQASGEAHPVFLKVAPDLGAGAVEDIVEAAVAFGLDGLIISNTTIARPSGLQGPHRGEGGGLSGAPLFGPSTRLLAEFHAASAGRLALIGVGGIGSAQDAYAKIRAGASAVQLYSALAYQGPALIGRILRGLGDRLRADGFAQISQAIGAR